MLKRISILAIIACCFIIGCKKIQAGFLSDTLRYTSPNLFCKRGLPLVQSDKIYADGSTPPLSYKMLNLRDSSGGKLSEAFNTEYEITVFKEGQSFNVDTDTTIELLNAKRETINVTPMNFNEVSGQLTFNRASVNLPLGIYNFDVQATNSRGSKFYPSIGSINVVDPTQDDLFTLEDYVDNAFSDATGESVPVASPKVTFTKISTEGARIILVLADKDGKPFNPSAEEIIKRGDRPTFENYTRFHPIVYTDTSLICDFEVAPFPLSKYIDATTDWGHLIYYRIPSNHVTIDGLPAHSYSANPRFAFDVNLEGTYEVKFVFPDLTRVP